MKKVIINTVIVFIVGMSILFVRSGSRSVIRPTPIVSDKALVKQISLSEVSSHSSAQDCWMAIEGNVYDVTKFVPEHPGEDKILLGCGNDATAMFNSRPGDGGAHSKRARELLRNFQIGVLVN